MSVPVVDLSPLTARGSVPASLAEQIDDACRRVGFLVVVGHGVDTHVEGAAWAAARRFFSLAPHEKATAAEPHPGYPYGYRAFAAETLAHSLGEGGPPDLKETFNIGPVDDPPRPKADMTDPDERAVYSENIWPSTACPELRPAMEAYYRAMATLADRLMTAFACALGLDAGWFGPYVDRHGSALRLAYYPAVTEPPLPNQLRAGAHTDYGTLTILGTDGRAGLQIRRESDTSEGSDGSSDLRDRGDWVDVEHVPGGYVVNLGDLLARWTNDRWRSTLHRVVVDPSGSERISIPFFHNANWDARVECIPTCLAAGEPPRYSPVLAGPHLMSKFRATVAPTPEGDRAGR